MVAAHDGSTFACWRDDAPSGGCNRVSECDIFEQTIAARGLKRRWTHTR